MKLQLSFALTVLAVCQALPRRLQHQDDPLQIVGGLEVDITDFPYQISMRRFDSHICGGSILSANWILTASHCVDGASASEVTVRAGSTMRNAGGQMQSVAWAGMHPEFNADTMAHDVALLQLAAPLDLDGDSARPVALVPVNAAPSAGSLLTVSGWGTLHSGDMSLPTHLMAVMVPSLPLEVCQQVYATRGDNVDDTMICAGVGGKDSCQGDSGGPLVNEQQLQVGVVSWGIGCAAPGYPGLYANLAHPVVRKWIVDKAGL